jgi:(4-alkanoyl-5-oxo-2,5-dihydrofuran-3-yl)methyl phosphate reductase
VTSHLIVINKKGDLIMILITGATGNVGSELVKQLFAKGEALRVVTRDESKVAHLDPSIERVIGEVGDPKIAERAVEGVDRIYLFPVITDGDHRSNTVLLEKAKKAGVKQIVMLSSMGAESSLSKIGELHRTKEVLVEESGIPWTFVRPGAFMSNTLQWQPTIKSEGKVFNPTGEGKLAPISPKDIAAAAAVALTSPGHEGKIYLLTGPELLNAREQVDILAKTIGRPIACVDVPATAVADQFSRRGYPAFIVEGLAVMWEGVKKGQSAVQTKDLESLTGSKGEKFENWCLEHRSSFN